jgi:hypothetical protein
MGRPPKYGQPMSGAERMRRYREAKQQELFRSAGSGDETKGDDPADDARDLIQRWGNDYCRAVAKWLLYQAVWDDAGQPEDWATDGRCMAARDAIDHICDLRIGGAEAEQEAPEGEPEAVEPGSLDLVKIGIVQRQIMGRRCFQISGDEPATGKDWWLCDGGTWTTDPDDAASYNTRGQAEQALEFVLRPG